LSASDHALRLFSCVTAHIMCNKIYVTVAYLELVGHMLETLGKMYSFEQH